MKCFMKKMLAAVLCAVMLVTLALPLMTVYVFAANDSYIDPSKPYPMFYENLITYTCQYDVETSKIVIKGTMDNDVKIKYKDWFLDVYVIAPGETVEKAVFSSDAEGKTKGENVSIKFDFSLSATTVAERFSRYAVVVRSSSGEKILVSAPQYIHVASQYEHDPSDRLPYKGIASEQTSLAGNLGAGTVIIPVYLNQLIGKQSGGKIYPIENGVCYFDSAYVDALDAKTRTYSASGTRVYFQLLLEANGSSLALANGGANGARYDFPNLQVSKNLLQISAAASFLAERYETNQSGLLSGMILGSSIDLASHNYTGGLSLEKYAEQYAFYCIVIAGSARMHRSEIDIILPFSSMDTYSDPSADAAASDYAPSKLLEGVLSVLDERLSERFACGTMIESDVVPMKLDQAGETPSYSTPQGRLSAENMELYEAYFNQLQKKYSCAPNHFIYRWDVPTELSETALNCAYAYSYYRMLRHQRLSSFVVSFSTEASSNALNDLAKVFRDIDTAQGKNTTAPLLSYFGAHSWEALLESNKLLLPEVRSVYRVRANTEVPSDFQGSFEYFDFSGNADDWFAGSGCQKVRTDFLSGGVRGVRGTMLNSGTGASSELLCLYEFPENFIYTPYLKLTLELSDSSSATPAFYELTFSMGNDTTTVLCEQTVRSGERCEIWLDLTDVPEEQLMTNYLKIGAAMIDGTANEFSIGIVGLTGYSEEYSSEELSELIEAERLRIRNQNAEDEEGNKQEMLLLIFGGLLLLSAVIVGALFFAKRNDEEELLAEDKEKDQNLK